jgi:hypothetical protein
MAVLLNQLMVHHNVLSVLEENIRNFHVNFFALQLAMRPENSRQTVSLMLQIRRVVFPFSLSLSLSFLFRSIIAS